MTGRLPKAFFSYTRFDDEHSRGGLTTLRKRLEDELRGQLGTPFEIFQDFVDLNVGVDFQQRIESSINDALFFIPVMTPSYFTSSACREELQVFRRREYNLLDEELIIPIYWIEIDRPGDELAVEVKTRNYIDFRELRLRPADSPEMDKKIAELATQIIKRLHEFNDHQRLVTDLKASIATPTDHDRVERYVIVTGTTENLPRALTPWLVVEADGRFHPQTSVATTRWTGRVTIGRRGFGVDNGEDFPIHVVATSGRTNDSFRKYLDEQEALPQQKRWHGLALPAAARVLATRVVRRDDQAATLVKLRGTYDEFRARPPQPTFGTIEIKGTPHGDLTLSAIDKAGEVEWTGSITVNSQTGEITGQYKNTKNQGEGTLQVTQDRDEISITGQGKAAGAKPFFMAWRRRS